MSDCDRCGREYDELTTVDLGKERDLCDACIGAIREKIDYHDWTTRYTEEQHERATKLLGEAEEIECVISSYDDGQIVVHTPYVSSDVITDICDHFGFVIVSFGPQWKADQSWPCMNGHGDTFEIVLEYNHSCRAPIPLAVKFQQNHIERLDGNDKQF